MISSTVTLYLDYGVLGVLGLGVLVCLFGTASALCLPHCHARRNAPFYGTWAGRAALSALGALLLASQLLRMTHVWAQTTVAVEETTSGLGLLCRLYLCIALGLLQPWFLFLALLLCRHGISPEKPRKSTCGACFVLGGVCGGGKPKHKRSKSATSSSGDGGFAPESPNTPNGGELISAKHARSSDDNGMHNNEGNNNSNTATKPPRTAHTNLRMVLLSLCMALPVAALQGVVAWMSRMISGPGWDADPGSPGHYFFSPYDWATGAQCPQEVQDAQGCVLCVFPAASTIVTCCFAVVYSVCMVWSSREVQGVIINRRLRRRLRMLQALVVICLGVQVSMAGVSVASSPWEVLFTVCWVVLAFVTVIMVISVTWILVVFPMWSIHRAHKAAPRSEARMSAYAPTELEMQLWPQDEESNADSPVPVADP